MSLAWCSHIFAASCWPWRDHADHSILHPIHAAPKMTTRAPAPENRMQWRISRMPSHVHALTLDTHHSHSHTSLMWCGWVYWHGVVNARRPRRREESTERRVCDGTLFSPPILDYVDDSLIDSLTLYTHSLVTYSGENTLHSLSATIQNPRTKRPHMKGNTHPYSPSWSLCELTRVPIYIHSILNNARKNWHRKTGAAKTGAAKTGAAKTGQRSKKIGNREVRYLTPHASYIYIYNHNPLPTVPPGSVNGLLLLCAPHGVRMRPRGGGWAKHSGRR